MTLGLTQKEAEERLIEFGPNILPSPKQPGIILIFLQQFLNPLVYMLLAAAIVSIFLDEINDAIFIFVVLIINASIGAVQEYSASRASTALQKIVPTFASVLRNGEVIRIEAEKIVPGDIILLESGDKVPADIQLSKAKDLSIDESLLTGESVAVEKSAEEKSSEADSMAAQFDTAFAGTVVVRGRGQGVVTATSIHTELGKIAKSITAKSIIKPPLLLRIEKFTLNISLAMLALISIMFLISWYQGGDMTQMFLIAVALAVAAIPEGLPAAITITLAIGMKRMAKSKVVIRKLLAVESLGSCTFIASDKTGTLTVNELTIRKIILPDESIFDVTGEGTNLKGEIISQDGKKGITKELEKLIEAGIFANESTLDKGDMVDIGFLVLGEKANKKREGLLKQYPQVSEIPYESENGFSASINEYGNGQKIFVKGSAEKILDMCGSKTDKQKIIKQMEELASSGYRVIALAEGDAKNKNEEDNLKNLTFLGLVGMIDPLRSEAREAVDLCKKAGIEVAMITGDHPATAKAIAIDLGLCGISDKVVTGSDIKKAAKKGSEEIKKIIMGVKVFARIEPAQKQQIVEALIELGHFVAVTGDGVNDAPALKHSHVGVAMGKRGTDVARESADLIITDDDFASIVKGVHEGRVVYSNIRKVISLLIATGSAEIVLFILSMIAGLPMPLLAAQLLWLNLVTNGIQHVALAFEPAEGDELSKAPRKPNEPIFDKLMIKRVVINGVYMGILAFSLFYALFNKMGYEIDAARNMTLLMMVFLENMHALNSRSETTSILKQKFFGNPFLLISVVLAQIVHVTAMYIPGLKDVLHMEMISISQWLLIFAISISLLIVGEIEKRWVVVK